MAHRRGLRQGDRRPYRSKGSQEDKDHLLWWCEAWKATRDRILPKIMLLASWPNALRS